MFTRFTRPQARPVNAVAGSAVWNKRDLGKARARAELHRQLRGLTQRSLLDTADRAQIREDMAELVRQLRALGDTDTTVAL